MSSSTTSANVLLVSADLFLGSRVRGAADAGGYALDVARSSQAAAARLGSGRYRLVLIDLETPGFNVTEFLQRRGEWSPAAFIAYGPHVRVALLESARQAGCEVVLTRGQFDASIGDLLSRFLQGDADSADPIDLG